MDSALLSFSMTPRIFALFIGLLTLLNLLGNLLWPGFDASGWWISFGPLPDWLTQFVLLVSVLLLLNFAYRGPRLHRRCHVTCGAAMLLATVALLNTITFYRLLFVGHIYAGFPVPLSLAILL